VFSDEEGMGGVMRGGGGWVPLLGAGSVRRVEREGEEMERELSGGYAGVAANVVPGWARMGLFRR
jgi:hypothetical protein